MRLHWTCTAALFLSATLAFTQTTPPAPATGPQPAYMSDPKVAAALKEASGYLHIRAVGAAISEYRKADKLAGGKCDVCLRNIYSLSNSTGQYKDAAEAMGEMAAIAPTPAAKADAEVKQALALTLAAGDKPKPDKLAPADQLLKTAVADDPKNISARYYDGRILAQMGQLEAARAMFNECIQMVSPKDPLLNRMKRFADEPELSYQRRAPQFTFATLDGSKFNLDEMYGRVVLIDFWATWCGPCNEELPHLKRIAKEFAGQPLVMVSISWDSDDAKWKQFIEKNEMTWAQYRDADHKLSTQFGINAIPHYFTVDSDGVLTAEIVGSGSDVEGKLRKLLAKAKAEQVRMQTADASAHPAQATP